MTNFSRHRFHILDGMRGIAAILVMLHHYYQSEVKMPSNFASTYLSGTALAVDIFFILSGYVVCHSYGDKLLNGMTYCDYVSRRVARLFPMMAIGLLSGSIFFYLLSQSGHTTFTGRDILASTISNLMFIPYLNAKETFFLQSPKPGLIFPADKSMWSVFFELCASLAFISLVRAGPKPLLKICAISLAGFLLMSTVVSIQNHDYRFQLEMGWGTENLLGGFPRVFYGFTCGVLIYRTRAQLTQIRWLNKLRGSSAFNVILLYLLLIVTLMVPHSIKGLYFIAAILVIAPLLIFLGGEAKCENRLILAISELLGWLSYPLYCLHIPCLFAMWYMDEKTGYFKGHGYSYQSAAIALTIISATLSGYLLDKLRVQKKLAVFLNKIFNFVFPKLITKA